MSSETTNNGRGQRCISWGFERFNASVSKFALKNPSNISVVTALLARKAVSGSFACRIREESNSSNVWLC